LNLTCYPSAQRGLPTTLPCPPTFAPGTLRFPRRTHGAAALPHARVRRVFMFRQWRRGHSWQTFMFQTTLRCCTVWIYRSYLGDATNVGWRTVHSAVFGGAATATFTVTFRLPSMATVLYRPATPTAPRCMVLTCSTTRDCHLPRTYHLRRQDRTPLRTAMARAGHFHGWFARDWTRPDADCTPGCRRAVAASALPQPAPLPPRFTYLLVSLRTKPTHSGLAHSHLSTNAVVVMDVYRS